MTHPDTTAQDKAMREAYDTLRKEPDYWLELRSFGIGWQASAEHFRALLSDPTTVEEMARAFLSDSFKGIGRQSIPPGILAHAEEQAQAALLAIRKTLGVE
jgi:hypothetical protein